MGFLELNYVVLFSYHKNYKYSDRQKDLWYVIYAKTGLSLPLLHYTQLNDPTMH